MAEPFGFGLKNGGGHGPIKVIGNRSREKVLFILTKQGIGYTSRKVRAVNPISFFITRRANGNTSGIPDALTL